MLGYVIRRLLFIPFILLTVSIILFGLIQIAPGDPVALLLPEGELTPEVRERLIQAMGLDKPVHEQYLTWLRNWVQGDWGYSFSQGMSVRDAVLTAIPVTLELQGLAILLALIISIPVGILSAVKKYSIFDHTATVFSLVGISMPDFWLGLTLMMLLGVQFGWLPTVGMGEEEPFWSRIPYYIMPVLVLATSQLASFTRFMRSGMLEELNRSYVRTARAKGLSEVRILSTHMLKNALLPFLTILGLALVRLLGGSVIVESIFGWPGLGRLALRAVLNRDAVLVLGITMITAIMVMIINLIVDLFYTVLDPRVSFKAQPR